MNLRPPIYKTGKPRNYSVEQLDDCTKEYIAKTIDYLLDPTGESKTNASRLKIANERKINHKPALEWHRHRASEGKVKTWILEYLSSL